MTKSTLNKFLSIISLASIATTIAVSPVLADYPAFKDETFRGSKGTYTVKYSAGTYRGCLNSGGCITLSRKYLVPCNNPEPDACEVISWKKGPYVYAVHDLSIRVYKNGKEIFKDEAKL
jgi:hypothetical protein